MKMPQPYPMHVFILYLCKFFNKLWVMFGFRILYSYRDRLDKEYSIRLKEFSEQEIKQFIEERGVEFTQSLEQQDLVAMVPLGNSGCNPPGYTLKDLRKCTEKSK